MSTRCNGTQHGRTKRNQRSGEIGNGLKLPETKPRKACTALSGPGTGLLNPWPPSKSSSRFRNNKSFQALPAIGLECSVVSDIFE